MKISEGLFFYPSFFNEEAQRLLVAQIHKALEVAPFFTPTMPKSDKPFSVKMSNAGELGWVSDKAGYRYQATHPETHKAWGEIPPLALEAWRLSEYALPPEACLINDYAPTAKMGLHQDRDEKNLEAPVVSISLGCSALFRYGGLTRAEKTKSLMLHSGDVLIFGGQARLMFHGIDRIKMNSSTLLPNGHRYNLTLRRVN